MEDPILVTTNTSDTTERPCVEKTSGSDTGVDSTSFDSHSVYSESDSARFRQLYTWAAFDSDTSRESALL